MKKDEYIEQYSEEAWERMLEQSRIWKRAHPEHGRAGAHEQCRKNGKYYENRKVYNHTPLRSARERIRKAHAKQYRPFKMIIAPESQIHHEWIPKTAKYNGFALVEAKPHQYGIVDVIQILDGEITLLTEEDVKKGKQKEDKTF